MSSHQPSGIIAHFSGQFEAWISSRAEYPGGIVPRYAVIYRHEEADNIRDRAGHLSLAVAKSPPSRFPIEINPRDLPPCIVSTVTRWTKT
jgi:hypothetical protein